MKIFIRPERRWFRYSLRAMLVFVTLLAVVIGWYTHRQRIIKAEKAKLLGGWDVVIRSKDISIYSPSLQLSEAGFSVGMPNGSTGTIEFHGQGGRQEGIYRVDGDKLVIAQNDVGKLRPTALIADQADFYLVGTRAKAARVCSETATAEP